MTTPLKISAGTLEQFQAGDTITPGWIGSFTTSQSLYYTGSVIAGTSTSWSPNYFGTGADGAGNYTSGTTNLATTSGVNDTGYVVANYTTLSISAGAIVNAANRAQIMIIYCTGNCTINGTLSMNALGAAATTVSNTTIIRSISNNFGEKFPLYLLVSQTGASGGAGGTTTSFGVVGSPGSAGVNSNLSWYFDLQTGGGGGGAGGASGTGNNGTGGAGATGNAFVGGSGGGAGGFNGTTGTNAVAGLISGGTGGNSGGSNAANRASGGGAGNAVGTGNAGTGASVVAPTGGGGGTIYLIVGGTLTMGSAGLVTANGGNGGNASGSTCAMGGGGAGGGVVYALIAGATTAVSSLTNTQTVSAINFTGGGVIQANGGAGGTATSATTARAGGAGGAGAVTMIAITNP